MGWVRGDEWLVLVDRWRQGLVGWVRSGGIRVYS